MRPDPIKLTRDQLDTFPKAPPRPGEPSMALLGIPVEIVDHIEDSSPFQFLANRIAEIVDEKLRRELENWKPTGLIAHPDPEGQP